MNKLFSLAVAALVVAACNTSGSRNSEATAPAPPPAATTPSVQLPGANNAGTGTNTQVAPPTTNSDVVAALNPAHGAPGHRCDIPVGAPLNTGASSAPAATTINPAPPVMLTPPPIQQPANGSVRLNPAHGAPGHDCSIPVGQRLRS